VQKGGARFDRERLLWLNGQWIRRLEEEDLVDRLRPFLAADHMIGRIDRMPADEEVAALVPLVRERLPVLGSITETAGFVFVDDLEVDPALLVPKRCGRQTTLEGLRAASDAITGLGEVSFEAEGLETALRALAAARDWKPGDLFMALRVAITGRTATPPLFDTMVAVGRDRVIARLERAVARLEAGSTGTG
jgi:glutamyl-tRNA synthetase